MKRKIVTLLFLFAFCVGITSAQDLRLQYQCVETQDEVTNAKFNLNLINDGSQTVDLSKVKMRYYFNEDYSSQTFNCYWAVIGAGNITGTFVDDYLEIGFGSGAPDLAAGSSTGTIEIQFHNSNWTNLTQPDHPSFKKTITSYTDYEKIPVYYDGSLVYGSGPVTSWAIGLVESSESLTSSFVEKTTDGGYVAAGLYVKDSLDYFHLTKIDDDGTVLWQKKYGGYYDMGLNDLTVTSDGSFLMVGYRKYSSTSSTGKDAWVMKVGSTGAHVWSKRLSVARDDEAMSVIELSDGEYAVGAYISYIRSRPDSALLKFSPNGTYNGIVVYGSGCAQSKNRGIVETTDGNIVLLNEYDASPYEFQIMKCSKVGALQNQKIISTGINKTIDSIISTPDNGVVVWADEGTTINETIILKINQHLGFAWRKMLTTSYSGRVNDIMLKSNGNLALLTQITPLHWTDNIIVEMDQNGNLLQTSKQMFGVSESDRLYSLVEGHAGGYVAVGIHYQGASNVLIVKAEADGSCAPLASTRVVSLSTADLTYSTTFSYSGWDIYSFSVYGVTPSSSSTALVAAALTR